MATEQQAAGEAKSGGGGQGAPRFESELNEGRERFLAQVIEHGFTCGRRTADDFIRHFPPETIMEGLKDNADLRAKILVETTGVREKVARKKPAEYCAMDLKIALEELVTDAETVVSLIEPDDRVRFLDHQALWAYITEGAFWEVDPARDGHAHKVAVEHVAYMIDRALRDELLTHRDVVDGITVAKLAELLPRSELGQILSGALEAGRANRPFVDRDLMKHTPTTALTEHIPLPWIWDNVINPRIAEAHGLTQEDLTQRSPSGGPVKAEPAVADDGAADGEIDLEVDDFLGSTEEDKPMASGDDSPRIPRPPAKPTGRK